MGLVEGSEVICIDSKFSNPFLAAVASLVWPPSSLSGHLWREKFVYTSVLNCDLGRAFLACGLSFTFLARDFSLAFISCDIILRFNSVVLTCVFTMRFKPCV
jgi:hypothetical protein